MFKLESMDQLVIGYYWVYEVIGKSVDDVGLYEYDGDTLNSWDEIDEYLIGTTNYIVVPVPPPNIENIENLAKELYAWE